MRVLVAPDKFKGSLTAAEVAEAIARGLTDEGIEFLSAPAGGRRRRKRRRCPQRWIPGPPGQGPEAPSVTAHEATVAVNGETAVVEVANTCGLATLVGGLAPMTSSTYGFGQAILAARDSWVHSPRTRPRWQRQHRRRRRHAGRARRALPRPARTADRTQRLRRCIRSPASTRPRWPTSAVSSSSLPATSRTRFCGPEGAAAVFGPQKGVGSDQVAALDSDLAKFVSLLPALDGPSPESLAIEPGAGAAGGLGFACRWLGGIRVPGADFFLDLLGFDEAVAACDVVITGEGSIDSSDPERQAARRRRPPLLTATGPCRRWGQLPQGSDQHDLGLSGVHCLSEMTDEDTRTSSALSQTLATLPAAISAGSSTPAQPRPADSPYP